MGGCSKEGDKYNRIGLMGFQYSNEPKFNVGQKEMFYQVSYEKQSGTSRVSEELLKSHLTHLDDLSSAGVLKSYGANASGNGGFNVLTTASEKKAIEIASSDPLVESGHYSIASVTKMASWQNENAATSNHMLKVK